MSVEHSDVSFSRVRGTLIALVNNWIYNLFDGMMNSIASAFRARYLDTHEKYLDSIATLLAYCNNHTSLVTGQFMLRHVTTVKTTCSQMRALNSFDEVRALRNLRNSWYHECALHYPQDLDDRLKFAPWKIIQFFYAIYSALSAIVRCFNNRPILRQQIALDQFTTQVIINPATRIIPVPLCFYRHGGAINPSPDLVISWPYGLSYHVPNVERCLQSSLPRSTSPVSLFHYFKSLREWANYEDSYIFTSLYGPSVISMLDHSLRTVVSGFLPVVEVFLISFYGWDKVNNQSQQFSQRIVRNLKIVPTSLISRFDEYTKCPDLVS